MYYYSSYTCSHAHTQKHAIANLCVPLTRHRSQPFQRSHTVACAHRFLHTDTQTHRHSHTREHNKERHNSEAYLRQRECKLARPIHSQQIATTSGYRNYHVQQPQHRATRSFRFQKQAVRACVSTCKSLVDAPVWQQCKPTQLERAHSNN